MTAQQLKNAILQEAIQGRLVPQDPNDEPASVLLDRIRKEKELLYKDGFLKKNDLKGREIKDEEVPFVIPSSWVWTKIDNIAFVTKLAGFEYSEYIANNLVSKDIGVPLFKGKNVQNGKIVYEFEAYIPLKLSNELKRSQINKKCLLTPYVGTIGNIGIHDKEGIFHLGSNVGKIEFYNGKQVNILEEYAKFYLMSKYGYQELTKYKKATAQESISIEAIRDVFIPIPPIEEQRRIVNKISSIFVKVEEYGKAQEKLNKLNEELPERLKKSILQEAIEGRLVPQDPNDEPASVLLSKILEEKKQLVKEGKLKKKDLEEKPISEDEIPFEIPESWEWCRIEQYTDKVTDFVASGSFATLRDNVKYYKEENYALLVKTKDFQSNFETDLTYTDERGYNFLANSNLYGGELILSNVGSIGKIFVVPKLDRKMTLAPNAIMVRFWDERHRDWFLYLFQSGFGLSSLYDISSATAIRKFNKTDFKRLLVPIPPLAEQHRIVEKIVQLFKEIDKLKTK